MIEKIFRIARLTFLTIVLTTLFALTLFAVANPAALFSIASSSMLSPTLLSYVLLPTILTFSYNQFSEILDICQEHFRIFPQSTVIAIALRLLLLLFLLILLPFPPITCLTLMVPTLCFIMSDVCTDHFINRRLKANTTRNNISWLQELRFYLRHLPTIALALCLSSALAPAASIMLLCTVCMRKLENKYHNTMSNPQKSTPTTPSTQKQKRPSNVLNLAILTTCAAIGGLSKLLITICLFGILSPLALSTTPILAPIAPLVVAVSSVISSHPFLVVVAYAMALPVLNNNKDSAGIVGEENKIASQVANPIPSPTLASSQYEKGEGHPLDRTVNASSPPLQPTLSHPQNSTDDLTSQINKHMHARGIPATIVHMAHAPS